MPIDRADVRRINLSASPSLGQLFQQNEPQILNGGVQQGYLFDPLLLKRWMSLVQQPPRSQQRFGQSVAERFDITFPIKDRLHAQLKPKIKITTPEELKFFIELGEKDPKTILDLALAAEQTLDETPVKAGIIYGLSVIEATPAISMLLYMLAPHVNDPLAKKWAFYKLNQKLARDAGETLFITDQTSEGPNHLHIRDTPPWFLSVYFDQMVAQNDFEKAWQLVELRMRTSPDQSHIPSPSALDMLERMKKQNPEASKLYIEKALRISSDYREQQALRGLLASPIFKGTSHGSSEVSVYLQQRDEKIAALRDTWVRPEDPLAPALKGWIGDIFRVRDEQAVSLVGALAVFPAAENNHLRIQLASISPPQFSRQHKNTITAEQALVDSGIPEEQVREAANNWPQGVQTDSLTRAMGLTTLARDPTAKPSSLEGLMRLAKEDPFNLKLGGTILSPLHYSARALVGRATGLGARMLLKRG